MQTRIFSQLCFVILLVCSAESALANATNLSAFQSRYISTTEDASCQICHTVAPSFNAYGLTISMLSGAIATRLQNAESQDSDGQGDSNIDEINSGTQPGWLAGASGAPAGVLDPQDPTA